MKSPFLRPTHTAAERDEHELKKNASRIALILQGHPTVQVNNFFTGKTSSDLIKHRISEVNAKADLGWGEFEAIRLMKHYATKATSLSDGYACQWAHTADFANANGKNDLAARVIKQIQKLQECSEPALHIAEAEFDPRRVLRKKFKSIRNDHICRVRAIKQQYAPILKNAVGAERVVLHEKLKKEMQAILNSMAKETSLWSDSVFAACRQVGLG